jgi:predicted unusual protein kinase regulating ubiquinone biosynthesis (AarF/ABC1/UbiB family)
VAQVKVPKRWLVVMAVTLGTAGAGMGAAAAVVLRRRARRHAGGLPSGRGARNAEVAKLASRVGRTYALSSARQVFASAERREQLKAEQQLKSAAEVVEALGSMKGALMKLGQMASYLDTGLPQPMRQALASLQSDAPPMSPELAAGVVRDEFGVPPDRLFAEWDPTPIAAASIGQVHRAMTHDGMAVAVKIQYPGVDEAIRSDLDNSALLVQIVGMVFPGLEADPVVDELRARLTEELDYRLEADNQQRFADGFAGHPFIYVPSVRADLSSRRVLTTELAIGARYDEVVGWPESERNMAAEAIFRFVFGSLYRYHAFNGDPHPGNYLFQPGGRVTFLDFGLVKWFSPNEVDLLAEMVDAMVLRRDVRAFRAAVEAAGFLKPDPSLTDEVVAAHLSHYYELVLEHGATTCTPEYATETVRRFFDATDAVVKRANVPPAFVVLQRINLGLYAVLAGLRATADWRRIAEEIWPWVGAEPSTELGRQEAAWRSEADRSFRSRV